MEANQDASTLNAGAPATETGEIGGIVEPDRPSFDPDGQNLFGTVEDDDTGSPSDADDKGAGADEGKAKEGQAAEGGADKGGAGEDGKKTRYDQDPAWQRIMQERDEARRAKERLEAQMEILTKVVDAPPDVQGKSGSADLPYKDTSAMSEEDLAEWQASDPKGYADNLRAQVKYELLRDLEKQKSVETQRSATERTYAEFAQKHPDLQKKWEAGEVQKLMKEHPGHNPMSAYLVSAWDEREATFKTQIEEAVAKAKADTEKEVLAKIKAKQSASVLGGGPAIAPRGDVDPALADTKRHGGMTAVLANKLAQMRRAGAGAS